MVGFSLKRLFASVTLIAIGWGLAAYAFRNPERYADDPITSIAAYTSIPVTGAGFMTPSKNTLLGASIGLAITIMMALAMFWPAVQ